MRPIPDLLFPHTLTPLQDALDRPSRQMAQLTAQIEELFSTVEALRHEVLASNVGLERASRELDAMRQQSPQQEQSLREARAELERTCTARRRLGSRGSDSVHAFRGGAFDAQRDCRTVESEGMISKLALC